MSYEIICNTKEGAKALIRFLSAATRKTHVPDYIVRDNWESTTFEPLRRLWDNVPAFMASKDYHNGFRAWADALPGESPTYFEYSEGYYNAETREHAVREFAEVSLLSAGALGFRVIALPNGNGPKAYAVVRSAGILILIEADPETKRAKARPEPAPRPYFGLP